jgi:release factor glutamine methyltransferase
VDHFVGEQRVPADAAGEVVLQPLGCGDLLDPPVLPAPQQPDVLIANLPYLTTEEATAGAGSLAYEPRMALDGGLDGLEVVRRLLALLPERLADGGVALLEIGQGHAPLIRDLVADQAMEADVSTLLDLAGIERVVRIARA